MPASFECDNCGRHSLNFRYWRCNECGAIACNECADTAGARVVARTHNQGDNFLTSVLKFAGSVIAKSCPNCEGYVTVIHEP